MRGALGPKQSRTHSPADQKASGLLKTAERARRSRAGELITKTSARLERATQPTEKLAFFFFAWWMANAYFACPLDYPERDRSLRTIHFTEFHGKHQLHIENFTNPAFVDLQSGCQK